MLFLRNGKHLLRYVSSPHRCRCKSNIALNTMKNKIKHGPGLKDFIIDSAGPTEVITHKPHIPYLPDNIQNTSKRKVYFDVYGCQMNLNDTEIVWSILKNEGYEKTEVEEEADIFLVMTCAIREGAETKIWHRLDHLRGFKNRRAFSKNRQNPVKIGILGCMAERLKEKLIEKEKAVDVGLYFKVFNISGRVTF